MEVTEVMAQQDILDQEVFQEHPEVEAVVQI
jgi:hypothetical protein